MTAPTRILVRLPNWLGDVLLARPLLHALRRGAPGAHVVAVAPEPLLALLAADGAFDAAVAWPRDPAGRSRATRATRDARPDAALVLPPSFSSAWHAWRSGARLRAGYAHDGRSLLLTRALRRAPRGTAHLAHEYLELARGLVPDAVLAETAAPPLAASPGARDAAASRLAALGLAGRPYAVLGPGAIYGPAKRWPAERFAALARALAERGIASLVCGTRDEADVCDGVAGAGGAVSLAGATALPELAALVAGAHVAVCNDSGLAHLCAAAGAPTVAVFGSTSSAWTAPLGAAVRIVQRAPVCSPCFQRTCAIGTVCLEAVQAAEVIEACEAIMRRS